MCYIFKMMPYNGCSQMLRILLKIKNSFIAQPWCLQLWALSVFIRTGQSLQRDEIRDGYLAWVRLVVYPVLNYACEVWGLHTALDIERVHLHFVNPFLDLTGDLKSLCLWYFGPCTNVYHKAHPDNTVLVEYLQR